MSPISKKRGRQKYPNLDNFPSHIGGSMHMPSPLNTQRRHRYGTKKPTYDSSRSVRRNSGRFGRPAQSLVGVNNVPIDNYVTSSMSPRRRFRSRSPRQPHSRSGSQSARQDRSSSPTNRGTQSYVDSSRSPQRQDTMPALTIRDRHDMGNRSVRRRDDLASHIVGVIGDVLNFFKSILQGGAALGRRLGRRCTVQFKRNVYPLMHPCVGHPPERVKHRRTYPSPDPKYYESEYESNGDLDSKRRKVQDEWPENRPPYSADRNVCCSLDEPTLPNYNPDDDISASVRPGGVLPGHLRFSNRRRGSAAYSRSGSASLSRIDHYPRQEGSGPPYQTSRSYPERRSMDTHNSVNWRGISGGYADNVADNLPGHFSSVLVQ